MDKRVVFAVAGSGKTSLVIDSLSLKKRSLIVTYTNNNLANLRNRIINKFGYFPNNITLFSYYTFLYKFCYKPFLSGVLGNQGIFYKKNSNLYAKGINRYMTSSGFLYYNRIAKFFDVCEILPEINKRLEKYFDDFYIDEVQDIAGHDFNLLRSISNANINILCVGDFFQHTYNTGEDGSVNKSLFGNYEKYIMEFEKMGIVPDQELLIKSYRCSRTVCEFISENMNIGIESHRQDKTKINLIDTPVEAESIFNNNEIVKLFYQANYKYPCYSRNWGQCKGEDKYLNICIVLNKKTFKAFVNGELSKLAPTTKNKLYVAISRAKGNITFVNEDLFKKFKKRT